MFFVHLYCVSPLSFAVVVCFKQIYLPIHFKTIRGFVCDDTVWLVLNSKCKRWMENWQEYGLEFGWSRLCVFTIYIKKAWFFYEPAVSLYAHRVFLHLVTYQHTVCLCIWMRHNFQRSLFGFRIIFTQQTNTFFDDKVEPQIYICLTRTPVLFSCCFFFVFFTNAFFAIKLFELKFFNISWF